MRQIGTIADEADARRLADYLLTLDISTRLDRGPKGWDVWVHHEDRVPQARAELEAFVRNPTEPRYREAARLARARRKEAERLEREHQRNTRDVREIWGGPSTRRTPLTFALITISVALTLLANFGANDHVVLPLLFASFRVVPLSDVPPEMVSRGVVDAEGNWTGSVALADLREGQLWRPITPIFLHGDALHLLLNMYWVYLLGGAIELRRGTWRLAGLVLVAAVLSNLGQYLYTHDPRFYGMSGVVLALFGYVWMKGQFEPELGLGLSRGTVMFMMIYLAFTMLVTLPGVAIANAAHFVGLVVGVLIGLGPHLFGGRSGHE